MLQSALDERRIIVHYQPIIDLTGGSVAGFEALARITDHDGSILPPATFIPVAEDSGLDRAARCARARDGLREACDWLPTFSARTR